MMQYQLSPVIDESFSQMWLEGQPLERKRLYHFDSQGPPVNYDSYSFKAHSLTHVESPAHTVEGGKTLDQYDLSFFVGKCLVIKLQGNRYKLVDSDKGIYHWIIQKDEIEPFLNNTEASFIFITTENAPYLESGLHRPDHVLTLSEDAANKLVKCKNFKAYGTSWKSSDYNPGFRSRAIHKIIFEKGIIYENLVLKDVPVGEYEFYGLPVIVKGSSEMVVNPLLRRLNG